MAVQESTWRPVCEYFDAGHDLDECAAQFGVKRTTVKRYLLARSEVTGEPPPPEARSGRRTVQGVPARDLAPDQQVVAVRTLLNAKNILDQKLAHWQQLVAADPSSVVPDREVAAMRNLADIVRLTIDTHPGVMDIAAPKSADDNSEAHEGRLERIRRALLGRE